MLKRDKGSDAPRKDSTALQKCAKRTKKKHLKSASEPQKSKKLSSDALVFNAYQVKKRFKIKNNEN
jgi:hypothetical protein